MMTRALRLSLVSAFTNTFNPAFIASIFSINAFMSIQSPSNTTVVFILLALTYIDKLTQSTLMGRDVYVKHSAESKDESMQTLSVRVSMDHIASVVAPIFGGMLWVGLGAQCVFAAGAIIAVIFTFACSLVPPKKLDELPENTSFSLVHF